MPVVQRLNLSYESIRYYAYSVIKAQIPQVSRRADEDRFLHLISFIVYQTFKLNDLLIDTLLSAVQAAVNAAEKEQKEVYFRERDQRNKSFATLVEVSSERPRDSFGNQNYRRGCEMNDSQKVALIDGALNRKIGQAGMGRTANRRV